MANVADLNDDTTTITMPAAHATVTATYTSIDLVRTLSKDLDVLEYPNPVCDHISIKPSANAKARIWGIISK